MAQATSLFDDFTDDTLDTTVWSPQQGYARTGNAEAEIYELDAVTLDGSEQGILQLRASSYADLGLANVTLAGTVTAINSANTGTLSTSPQVLTINSVTNYPTAGGFLAVVHAGTTYQVTYTGVSGSALTGCTIETGGPITLTTGDAVSFTYPYKSGEINCRSTFQYGEFMVRAKFPPGNGIWPAFWLVESSGSVQEIDTLEWTGKTPTQVHNTYIWSYSPSRQTSNNAIDVGIDLSLDWHEYGLVWSPYGLVWLFDGTVTKKWDFRDAQKATTVVPSEQMTLIINLAIGSDATTFGGGPNAQTVFPAVYEVDWVRVAPLAVTPRFVTNASGQRSRRSVNA